MFYLLTYCRTSENFEVVSPQSDMAESELSLVIAYRWMISGGRVNITNFTVPDVQFSYRAEPNITRVYPLQHLYAYVLVYR